MLFNFKYKSNNVFEFTEVFESWTTFGHVNLDEAPHDKH
jgi:hypothetical protein